jgi:hypothetical protein
MIYFAMRVETMQSLSAAISVFGITAAVGIRKRISGFDRKLGPNDQLMFEQIGIQGSDNINLVDVSSNNIRPLNSPFRLNADGYQGIDFFFYPELGNIKISVPYTPLTAENAKEKLRYMGIIPRLDNIRRLTDEDMDNI